MNKTKTLLLGLLASALTLSAANAQGLLGERYADVNVGYDRFSAGPAELDGWGIRASVNLPVYEQPGRFGVDVIPMIDYLRVTGTGVTLKQTQIGATVRGFMPVGEGFKIFAGAGLDYLHFEAGSQTEDTTFIPLEVGVEVVSGPLSVTPFYRYSFKTDSDWENHWAVGVRTAYWFDQNWGATLLVSHTDFDSLNATALSIRGGVVFAF